MHRKLPLPAATMLPAATTFCLLLGLYLLTLAPDITWRSFGGDGGELMAAAITLGTPHPPGYPTYIWLGKAASWLPLEPVARRFHLLSALLAALAGAFISGAAQRRYRQPLPAAIAGLLVGLSPLVWSQATIAEVYSLNLLVLALWLYVWTGEHPDPFWLALWQGLALTTHLTSLLLLPLTLWRLGRGSWLKMMAGLLCGLLPYLTIPWLARPGSVIAWGQADTLEGFFWLVSGRLYQHQLLALPAAQWGSRLQQWFPLLLVQLFGLGWAALPLTWPAPKKGAEQWQLVALTLGAGSYLGYGFFYDSVDAAIFTMPATLLLSIPLTPLWGRWPRATLILPVILVTLNFSDPVIGVQSEGPIDLRTETIPILEKLPPDALVLTPGDPTIFTLWYFQLAEKRRPDLVFVDQNLFSFSWYRARLKNLYPELEGLEQNDWVGFMADNGSRRPLCHVALASDRPLFCPTLSDLGA